MKKHLQKIAAVLLCAALLAGFGAVGAAAEGPQRPDSNLTYALYSVADVAFKALLKGIALLIPPIGIPGKMPESVNFFPGMGEFKAVPADPSYTWKLGYAKASVTDTYEGDVNELFVTGTLDIIGKRKVSEIKDPPMAYVTALGDGERTAVFVSLDAFGITSHDVGLIRAALKEFVESTADTRNIVSINVSALHQHSTVDTLGMNGNVVAGVFLNSFGMLTGLYPPFSGKNKEYMKHLTNVVADTVKEAVNAMEPGELFYGKADISEYISEKRAPDCFDPDFHRLRFKPSDTGSKETWLTNAPIHTTGVGIGGTEVTSDWPYYIAENLEAYNGGTNYQLILGAQFAMGIRFVDPPHAPGQTGHDRMEQYGNLLAGRLKGIQAQDEERLPALLNIAHKEYTLPVDNPLHLLFFRLGIIDSTGRKTNLTGTKIDLKTEIGYMELGGKVAFALVPGEMEPALARDGNGLAADKSYRREEYKFIPMKDRTGGLPLIVFGLTNDQVGYIPLPNDIAHFVVFGNEEVNTVSTQVAPLTLKAFEELVASIR